MHAGLTKSNSGAQIFDFPKFSHRLSITILRTVGATVNNARAFTLSGCTVHVNSSSNNIYLILEIFLV